VILKFDLISVIFRLHGLSTVFHNFLKNVKTLEPKTYITILSIDLNGNLNSCRTREWNFVTCTKQGLELEAVAPHRVGFFE